MNAKLLKQFDNPDSMYRGAPFWAWNGKLDPEELRRQVRVMNRMGLGGFFMHSRVGLDTAYLSKEWFDCVEACIDEARKLNMRAWLYDEDRWPSGAAGGLVTKTPEYRMRSLVMQVAGKPGDVKWDANTVAVYTATVNGTRAEDLKKVARGKKPLVRGNKSILIFRIEEQPASSWYNGYTYLDTMNHEAVREFIKVTHEAYRKHQGTEFNKTVPGIFTDEPNYGTVTSKSDTIACVPWTASIPATFKKRYGYNLMSHLPEIFLDVKGKTVTPARYHFHDCITHLFCDAFARQIGEWCAKNNLLFTGHVLSEQNISGQNAVVGSTMRFYEHMQAPGMDILTEHNREYDTAKQVSSAARQFGRKWRLTETYGCTGWDFGFSGHKAIGDWQVALGINLRCQHLSWYTMEGQAKRDYPASIFYQSPWWESYSKVEDYFAKLHSVLSEGKEVRNVLVVHPNESAWVLPVHGLITNPRRSDLDAMLVYLRDSLLNENIDFDYGDEDILARHSRVSSRGEQPVLRVGKANYTVVVVPPMITIRKSTLSLLKRFSAAGGKVVFAGRVPEYVDATRSTEAIDLAGKCITAPAKGHSLARAVETGGRLVSITDSNGKEIRQTLHMLTETDDAYYLFVCNSGHTPAQLRKLVGMSDTSMVRDRSAGFDDVTISLSMTAKGQCLEFNAETGAVHGIASRSTGHTVTIHTSLPALGSRLFCIPKKRSAKRFPIQKETPVQKRRVLKKQRWEYALSENNAVVLDRPRFRISRGGWNREKEILMVDRIVREKLNIPRRGGQMVQPWARETKEKVRHIQVDLEYRFEVESVPSGNLFLALERPDSFSAELNGVHVSMDAECGWWCDKSLRRIPVDAMTLHRGTNILKLTCDYNEKHPGLEIVYLLGSFGASVKGQEVAMTALPARLKTGDWCKQGLPFYSGSVSYITTISAAPVRGKRIILRIPHYRGVAVRVLVDGKLAGIAAWPPDEVDITDLVKDRSELCIEVLGHRRNSHGPLHNKEKWPRWTGPGEYEFSDTQWTDDYQIVPCGLMSDPELLIR